jgi:hypothetical protein
MSSTRRRSKNTTGRPLLCTAAARFGSAVHRLCRECHRSHPRRPIALAPIRRGRSSLSHPSFPIRHPLHHRVGFRAHHRGCSLQPRAGLLEAPNRLTSTAASPAMAPWLQSWPLVRRVGDLGSRSASTIRSAMRKHPWLRRFGFGLLLGIAACGWFVWWLLPGTHTIAQDTELPVRYVEDLIYAVP